MKQAMTLGFFLFFLCNAGFSFAQDAVSEPKCQNWSFPKEISEFKMATVQGASGSKVHFYDESVSCPDVNNHQCQKKAYLIPGDQVIVSKQDRDFACVWYEPSKMDANETVGWLPVSSLKIQEQNPVFDVTGLLGDWKDGQNTVSIKTTVNQGQYLLTGEAVLVVNPENIRTGNVSGFIEPVGRSIQITDAACIWRAFAVGSFLVVSDNMECGGAYVTFTGVYKQSRP